VASLPTDGGHQIIGKGMGKRDEKRKARKKRCLCARSGLLKYYVRAESGQVTPTEKQGAMGNTAQVRSERAGGSSDSRDALPSKRSFDERKGEKGARKETGT